MFVLHKSFFQNSEQILPDDTKPYPKLEMKRAFRHEHLMQQAAGQKKIRI